MVVRRSRLHLALALAAALGGCAVAAGEAPPAGPGGEGTGGGGGETDCPDQSALGGCTEAVSGACPTGEVCTVSANRSCGADRCCTLRLDCKAREGSVGGSFLCEADADCASGACLSIGGVKSCLRACAPAGGEPCPEGLACTLVPLGPATSVHSCVGAENGVVVGAQTLCASDRDCLAGRHCKVLWAPGTSWPKSHGICAAGERSGEAGRVCQANELGPPDPDAVGTEILSPLCEETGLCRTVCGDADPVGCGCTLLEPGGSCRAARCMPTCAEDADCPGPLSCSRITHGDLPGSDPEFDYGTCRFPKTTGIDWGCVDETDCCAGGLQRDGDRCCVTPHGQPCEQTLAERTYCHAVIAGTHFTAACRVPVGLGELGAPCADGASCESGVCAPDGSCSSICMVGIGDRCGELVPGSRCCSAPVGEACVPECRIDCDTGPSCP